MATAHDQHVPTAVALEKARRRVGFSVEAAADELNITTRLLGDIESGMRTPGPDLIEAMVSLYGVEPGRIEGREWVPRVPARYDAESHVLQMGWTSIQIKEKDNDHIARSLAVALREMRSLPGDGPVVLRSTELGLLAPLFDLSAPDLPEILARYLRLTPNEALSLVNQMVVLDSVHG